MKSFVSIFLISLFFLIAAEIHAQEVSKPVDARFLLEVGAEWGGDDLITVQFTNGEDQTMQAGQGIHLAAGTELHFANINPLMVRASFGLKWAPTAADDANIAFTRLPLTISPFLKIKEDFRIGVGATAHLRPRFFGDGFIDNINFPTSIGPRVEIGYKFIAVTYTLMKYDLDGEPINGNSFGVILSYAWERK